MVCIAENVSATNDSFWSGIKIYCQKPNSINKEVLYSDIICSIKTESEITETECKLWCDKLYDLMFTEKKDIQEIIDTLGNIETFELLDNSRVLSDVSDNYIILRKMCPKKSCDSHRKFYEIGFFNMKMNKIVLYSLFDKDFQNDSSNLHRSRIFDPFLIIKFNRIVISYKKNSLVIEYDDNLGEKGRNWISSVFLKKLTKLILPKSENKVFQSSAIKFSSQINLINYYKLYDKMKLKYAKYLIENWPESTDPKKFVFEDIAISTYLLLLWNKGEIPDENSEKQKFVDLGCGNGLLVYILNSEGHKGIGLDIKKRKIWDMYPSNIVLKVEAVIPGPNSLYPSTDWLIGNHSDELTPWLPIMARRSGLHCQYFVLPCCPFQLNGQIYQRKNSSMSVYQDFLNYIRDISEICEFETSVDRLRIPSTKRICIIGRNMGISPERLTFVNQKIDSFIEKECYSFNRSNTSVSHTNQWISEFKVREAEQQVRNCTRLPKELINEILLSIGNTILKQSNIITIVKGNKTCKWNQGGRVRLSELANILSQDQLKYLKCECKGLQTLIKNNHYVFNVSEGMVRFRNVGEIIETSQNVLKNGSKFKWKQRDCWFNINHPQGCPLPDENCSYKHRSETIAKGNSK